MDLSHMSDADLEKIAGGHEPDHDKVVSKMSDEDLQKIVSGEPRHSVVASAGMHAIQQATGGLSDEAQGLGEAAGRLVGVKGAGGPMKDMGLAEGGPTHDWAILKDAYQRARDHERQTLAEQEKEHPVASGVGDVAGAIASPINKVTKGMSLAKAGAVMGGVNGFGKSEKEDLPGLALDTGIGTGLGAAMGAGLSKLGGGAKNVIDDVATTPLGPSAPPVDPNILGQTMRGAQSVGAKGNEILDKVVPGGKGLRYVLGGKLQAPLDALQNGPKMAQKVAGGMSSGIDSASDYLMKSPRMQELAQSTPKAFSALAGDLANKFSPTQAPVSEEQAKADFIKGN